MTDVTIIRHRVSGLAKAGGQMPVADGEIISQQTITLTATSQPFGLIATGENECWTVIVSGGQAIVKFGAAPVAAAGDGWPLVDGAMKPFSVPKGWTAAVIGG